MLQYQCRDYYYYGDYNIAMLLFTGHGPGPHWGGLVRTSVRRIRTAVYSGQIQPGCEATASGLCAAPFPAHVLALGVVWRVV